MGARAKGALRAAVCWGLAALLAGGLCLALLAGMRAAVPPVVQVYAAYGVGDTLAGVQEKLPGQGGALWQSAVLDGRTAVWAVSATSAYGSAAGLRLADGAWYGPDAVLQGRRYAVVPETLGGGCGVGAAVRVNGVSYEVCGVYRPHAGVLDKMAGDGVPAVYLSAPPAAAASEAPVQQLLLTGEETRRKDQLWDDARKALRGAGGTGHDLRDARALAGALVRLAVILALLVPVGWLMAGCWRALVALYLAGRQGAGGRAVLLRLGKALLPGMAALASVYGLLDWLRLPPAYLPPDDLFDLSHYTGLLTAFFQGLNGAGFCDVLCNRAVFYNTAAAFAALLLAVSLAAFLSAARRAALALRENN